MNSVKTKAGTELPLLNLKGKDYLQVAHRILWAREEMPDIGIETEIVSHDDDKSIVRATIRDASGRVLATATKHETRQGFGDHLEKAETGAIGRALALIGFGTQFAVELDEGERVVDAPLPKTSPVSNTSSAARSPLKAVGNTAVKAEPQFLDPRGQEEQELGAYECAFGKHKGKRLDDFQDRELESYVAWLESEAVKQNKPMSGPAAEFIRAAKGYLAL